MCIETTYKVWPEAVLLKIQPYVCRTTHNLQLFSVILGLSRKGKGKFTTEQAM
jgi:hypothetical protein